MHTGSGSEPFKHGLHEHVQAIRAPKSTSIPGHGGVRNVGIRHASVIGCGIAMLLVRHAANTAPAHVFVNTERKACTELEEANGEGIAVAAIIKP